LVIHPGPAQIRDHQPAKKDNKGENNDEGHALF